MGQLYDMIVVGGGPGGCTAALYASRAGLRTLVLEKLSAGGQMALSSQIDNYPGFEDGIDGFTLGEKMQAGAERFGAKTELTTVTSLDLSQNPKRVDTTDGTYYGKTLVIATGASPKFLGLPGEAELTGRGVNYCAACDGMQYRGKTVVVIGGGNSAAADALTLSRIAKEVIIVHRRDTLRATKVYHEPLLRTPNVTIRWNSTVTQLLHEQKLTGIVIRNEQTGVETVLPCNGIFVSIGRTPATQLVRGQLELDPAGYIMAGESTCTTVPGVFAVGDIRTKELRQIVTAVADGAVAAHYAQEYLAEQV